MRVRGFLALFLLVMVIIFFLWIIKGEKKTQTEETAERFSRVKEELTKVSLRNLEKEILSFMANEGRTPDSLKELTSFRPVPSGTTDAWGRTIKYERISDSNFRLISAGKDGVFGTEDDVVLEG